MDAASTAFINYFVVQLHSGFAIQLHSLSFGMLISLAELCQIENGYVRNGEVGVEDGAKIYVLHVVEIKIEFIVIWQ